MLYEVIVLGGGPAGYVAAIRAAQKGYKTLCISPNLGGTCLHEGCIPSKFLLNTSHHYDFMKNHAKEFGINIDNVNYDLTKIMSKKDDIINKLSGGIEGLFKKNKIEWIQKKGKFIGNKKIRCEDGQEFQASKAVIIATGSEIINIPFKMKQKVQIDNSKTALQWKECPKELLVVGAGYIGLELASVWSRFGANVTVIDLSDKFLPFLDRDVANAVKASLSKKMTIKMGVSIDEIIANKIEVKLTDGSIWKGDKILSAIGRKGIVNDIKEYLKIDGAAVIVDEYMKTSLNNVYAVGDITGGALLAHRGSDQGWIAIEHLYTTMPPSNSTNLKSCVPKLELVPSVIYLDPEVACVGKMENELDAKDYNVHKMPFASNGRAMTMLSTEGFVKVISSKKDGVILGVCAVGQNAESIICQAAVGMNFGATVHDFATICYPHPSVDEVLRETMFAGSIWGALHG